MDFLLISVSLTRVFEYKSIFEKRGRMLIEQCFDFGLHRLIETLILAQNPRDSRETNMTDLSSA